MNTQHHDDDRRTLLHVLPWTTAIGGALAVFLIPGALVGLSSLVAGTHVDGDHLPQVLGFLSIAAVGAFIFGMSAGTLAGLPDHRARHRPELRRRMSVLAVGILTVLISAAWLVARAEWVSFPPALTLLTTGMVAAVTAVCTGIVVVLHARRQSRRDAVRSAAHSLEAEERADDQR